MVSVLWMIAIVGLMVAIAAAVFAHSAEKRIDILRNLMK